MSNNYYKASIDRAGFRYFFFDDRDAESIRGAFNRAAEFLAPTFRARPNDISLAVDHQPTGPAASRVPVVPVVGDVANHNLVMSALDTWIAEQKPARPGPGLAKCGVPEASPSVAVGGGS